MSFIEHLKIQTCYILLALVWQLMKAYTVSILTQLKNNDQHESIDKEIIAWANATVEYFTTSVK